VVRIEGKHVLQANLSILEALNYAAHPQPSLGILLVLFDHAHQEVTSHIALARCRRGDPFAQQVACGLGLLALGSMIHVRAL
jgi:hypothetical protein